MDSADDLLTATDAGRILGLSRDMVRILSVKGRLAAQRASNGYYLFRRADVEQLALERNRSDSGGRRKGKRR
jgi:DNA-binding transcriptional MerR regulator